MNYISNLILMLFTAFFMSCQSNNQIVELSENVSIALPVDFKVENVIHTQNVKLISASMNDNQFTCSVSPLKSIDSIFPVQSSSFLEENALSYARSYNGQSVHTEDMKIHDVQAKKLSFSYIDDGDAYSVLSNVFIYENKMFILSYETLKKAVKKEEKRANAIFKSIQFQ